MKSASSARLAAARARGVRVDITQGEGCADVEDHFSMVDDWLRTYVSNPTDGLGRRGPVCPFVPLALKGRMVHFSFRYDVTDQSGELLKDILAEELAEFGVRPIPKARSEALLQSRVVVFPMLGPAGWRRIDDIYEEVKNVAIAKGLMIGQFHPNCDERAVRNPDFQVSRSPLGLCAMRYMAPHDILFLNRQRSWFAEYDRLFDSHFEDGRVRDRLMRALYSEAVQRYSADRSIP